MIYTTDLGVDKFHNGLLEIVQVHGILGRRTGNDIVVVVIVTTHSRKLLGIRKLDVHTVLLHDTLDAAASDANDTLVICLWDMERNFCGEFFLEESEALENGCIGASDVDEEVVVVEGFELDLDVRSLHDLVNLAILLAADELSVFIGQFDLEAYLVMEGLPRMILVPPQIKPTGAHLDNVQFHDQVYG